MRPLLLLIALLAAQAAAASPPGPANAYAAISSDPSLSAFKALLDAIGLAKPLAADPRVIVFAPTNAAVETFAREMGMSVKELAEHKALTKAVLANHIVVGVSQTPDGLLAKSKDGRGPVSVFTSAKPFRVIVTKPAGSKEVVLTDSAGHKARVLRALGSNAKFSVAVVDHVLDSGDFFPTLGDLFRAWGSKLGLAGDVIKKAGLGSLLEQQGFSNTMFLPTNEAHAVADERSLSMKNPSPSRLAELVRFHTVSGSRPLPDGFTSGKPVPTLLPGADLIVDSTKGAKGDFVRTVNGKAVPITRANLFVGKGVVHTIGQVLVPAELATTKPAVAGKVAKERGVDQAGRRLLDAPHAHRAHSWAKPTGDFSSAVTGSSQAVRREADVAAQIAAETTPADPDGMPVPASAPAWVGTTQQGSSAEGQVSSALSGYDTAPCC